MVLKKPYAFIIKYFRLIHLLTLIPMLYLVIKTHAIADFFRSYIASGYSFRFNDVLSNLASNYINILMYGSVILILGVFVTLSLVLQNKNKPTKYYNYSIVYYIGLFLLITACFNIFQMVEADTLNNTFARIIRDLTYIVYYSEYFFIIFTFVRGIGFNIKKFDFKSDLGDLEISSEDSEEFEFLVGIDTYKTKRTIRRFFRELKYYYKENKFIFNIIIVIAVGIIGTTIYMNRSVYDKVYNENETISFGYVNLKVKNAYLTSLSNSGKTIKDGKSYVIVEVEISNRYREEHEFNYANFRLLINKQKVSPDISLNNYFLDYGNPFNGTLIKGNSSNSYILTYEISKELANSSYTLEAFSRYDTTPGGMGAINKSIKIKPKTSGNTIKTNNVNKGATVNFKNSTLKNTELTLNDYEIVNRYEYTYKYCLSTNDCQDAINSISIMGSDLGRYTLLVIDYDLVLDSEIPYMNSNKNYRDFFEDFMEIEYNIGTNKYTSKINILNPNNYNDKLVLKVSNNISNADTITAKITNRDLAYNIKLK
ncbi:MAG: DUF4352 domain-containing protein [Ruminococcus sp.]|nr:DUF4352 domain-containing protein [Ruminococcus sp.]